ncbi:hypothetical protein ACLIBG_01240 [Virgibacillus sp. W0181]|uniref:hypothetical protein n=1 Tax=Virgibacillus sp. W0181 TaxID=3391581 RepID=UPI003F471F50
MNWLHWNDLITPSNPLAGLFFGIVISVVVSIGIWMETKDWKMIITVLTAGIIASAIVVLILNAAGFYS